VTDDELKAFIKAARQQAAPVGPGHALWDLIFDAEAMLVGGQTLLGREQIEQQIRLRVSRDREHGFHRIVSNDFRGS